MDEFLAFVEANPLFSGLTGATVAGAVVVWFNRLPAILWRRLLSLVTVSVDLTSTDEAYEWIARWLASTEYAKRCRRLTMSVISTAFDDRPRINLNTAEPVQFILFPALGVHLFRADGKWVWLTRETVDKQQGKTGRTAERMTLRVLGRNRGALMRILDTAYRMSVRVSENSVQIFTGEYGDWSLATERPKRSIESVVLPRGMAEHLVEDLEHFLGAADWYAERGVPYRRGYLLYGPPGCGKTSIVLALASRFNMGVAVINLTAVQDDAQLLMCFRNAPRNTFFLIEDIDAAFVKREHKDARGATFSGLLNAIDGIASRSGQVLFMTTNHIERLDEALIRPGRVDVRLHVPLADADQAARLYKRFLPGASEAEARAFGEEYAGKPPAEIQVALMSGHETVQRLIRYAA